jgi:two-component system, LuxR family, response regulator FixJ
MIEPTVIIVDDDADVRDSLHALLESEGFSVRAFESAKRALSAAALGDAACLIADIRMPDMDGLRLQEELAARKLGVPVIVVTGHGDVPLAVRAMKAGAIDFIEKPFDGEVMLESVRKALALSSQTRSQASLAKAAESRIESLTGRERQVLAHLVAGRANKLIAYELDISPRTVEIHRAHLMEKMQARSLSELIRLALGAGVAAAPKRGG